jgi:hypothetical protein
MASNLCPIIHTYISSIQSFVETVGLRTLYENELSAIEIIASDNNLRIGSFDLTCLRGFMCIDWMCGAINTYDWAGGAPYYVPARSWQGLTELKTRLDAEENKVALDRAEFQLSGAVGIDGVTPTRTLNEIQVRTVLGMADRSLLLASTIASIVLLRPFLKNQKGPVGGIGKSLYQINVTTGSSIKKMVDHLIQLSTVKYERLQ